VYLDREFFLQKVVWFLNLAWGKKILEDSTPQSADDITMEKKPPNVLIWNICFFQKTHPIQPMNLIRTSPSP
jgi:hypothetical protein